MKQEKIEQRQISKETIRIAVSRTEFMTKMPRFYEAFDYVSMWSNEEIGTLCVAPIYDEDTKEYSGFHDLMWSAKFTSQLSNKQLIGVQMHELLHIILRHTTSRKPEYKSFVIDNQGRGMLDSKSESFKKDMVKQYAWNIATDLSINCMLEDWLIDSQGWQGGLFPGISICDEKSQETNPFKSYPKYQTADWYYDKLMSEQEKQEQEKQKSLDEAIEKWKKAFEDGQIGDHSEWIEIDKDGNVTKEGKTQKGAQSIKANEDGPEKSPLTAKEINDKLDEIGNDIGIQAGTSSGTKKSRDFSVGKELKTPGWMKKATHASVHGFELAPFLSRKVPNRRFGIVFPGRRKISVRNKCLIAVDVSYSIDKKKLITFTQHLNRMKKHADFDLVFFNSQIIDPKTGQSYQPEEAEKATCKWKTGMEFYVGGGTNFEPVILFWNRIRNKYSTLFIFTDGEAGYDTIPKNHKDINWILYGNSKNAIIHGNKYDMVPKPEKYSSINEVNS
jgi:predicted metal-dependent peptidase